MQITSLYIDDYRLLKDFTINFSKDVSILIGINGSGKSSILECIAQIFSDAYLQEKSKFGFKLEYELRLEEIHNAGKKIAIAWKFDSDDEDMKEAGEEYSEIVEIPFQFLEN